MNMMHCVYEFLQCLSIVDAIHYHRFVQMHKFIVLCDCLAGQSFYCLL